MPLTVSRAELLVDDSDAVFRKLVHNLFAFLYRHETIRGGHGERIGLAGIEYTILISIAHLNIEQEVNIKTVSDHLHVTGAFVTRVVNKLVKLGLVDKNVTKSDRRRVTLKLARKGREKLDALAPVQRQVNDIEFKSLRRQDFLALVRIIDGLVKNADEAVALQTYLKSTHRDVA
ncbi:MarR family winged helix-turn-helix transcriptional regulator [Roseiarcaceae bacterium H3SJ34-1]|uniref:MarR family winged helix-turn-helix transcriptional regulator n=1 Tax=Terripilifer ovatus TaxID=3032367 RepID=UPI003AB97B69|nr:MarR family winged helix-turn-helix transcriptional regulator [Roseiarcaceae bacterium H3SJ34-1]